MKDPLIQEATASEPLTLSEEYDMQKSWRQDADKLTFIICRPLNGKGVVPLKPDGGGATVSEEEEEGYCVRGGSEHDDETAMVGDINLFVSSVDDEEEEEEDGKDNGNANPEVSQSTPSKIIGELEIMIPHASNQRHGYGESALCTFLRYIARHESEIVSSYISSLPTRSSPEAIAAAEAKFSYLRAKIHESNMKSIALFTKKLGFRYVGGEGKANYFGEVEVRNFEEWRRDSDKRKRERGREIRYVL